MSRDFVRTLSAVVDLAVDVINRPSGLERVSTIVDLAERVDADRATMVEGGAVVRAEATLLLDVLAQIEGERASGTTRSGAWCMVAGVLLPMVRENLFDALQRRPRSVATTDHDFKRGKS